MQGNTRKEETYLTVKEASKRLRRPVSTIYKWRSKGHIDFVICKTNPGFKYLVSLNDIFDHMKKIWPNMPRNPDGSEKRLSKSRLK